ncbi:probable methyltransferase-like protein 24 [Patella vulgata]|uniref:probable methyltransferase-like protein 24 n=1 Tax=Patella vulgata TaxID=6465 RepID=UPI0024A898E8|nr:probable methyltransferase-like protein 24 [Patella vulgata]
MGYFDQPLEHKCIYSRWMGNWKVCFDETSAPRKSCLVYSFGIANDFSFDEAMEAEGCMVYSFDPSMGVEDHKHSVNVYFKNLGLGSHDMDNFSPRSDEYVSYSQKWKIRTLKSILIMLGHEKRFIDVLKFDVEGYEWEIMLNLMKDGLLPQIGQILTEWHIFPDLPPREMFFL